MNTMGSKPKVAVVGTGAVGGYFGGMLARAGVPVVLIGRPAFVEAVQRSGLFLDSIHFQETVHPRASTELSAAAEADVVLFCVKTTDTASTAKLLVAVLPASALVVSLQNGVNNVGEIRSASGIDALAAVVYVAASVPTPRNREAPGAWRSCRRPEKSSNRKGRESFFFLQHSVPHFGEHRGRALDQAGVELRAERDLGAGECHLRRDDGQSGCKAAGGGRGLRDLEGRSRKGYSTAGAGRSSCCSHGFLQNRGTNARHAFLDGARFAKREAHRN